MRILNSLDMSAFSQEELSIIIRNAGQIPFELNPSVLVFKDVIRLVNDSKGVVFFLPQHYRKLK